MRYAELVSMAQGNVSFEVDPKAIFFILKEDLAIDEPLLAEYNDKHLSRLTEALIWKAHEEAQMTPQNTLVIPALTHHGIWFRAASYRVTGGWIEGRGKVEQYSLTDTMEELFPALVALGKDVRMDQAKDGTIRLAPEERERYVDFHTRFGPLGLYFREVRSVIEHPGKKRLEVQTGAGEGNRHDAQKYFGQYLRAPAYKHVDLLRNYREHEHEVAMAAVQFSLAATGPEWRIEGPVVTGSLEQSFSFSEARVSMEAGNISISWETNSLLDSAYAYLFKGMAEGGFRTCADPKCRKLFKRDGKRIYCSDRCAQRVRMEKYRAAHKGEI